VADAEALFAEHQRGVFRYLCRILGHSDAARDLTQEVFLRAARAGVPETSAIGRKAWVFRIARNLALNHARDTRRRPAIVELGDRHAPATQELAAAIHQALAAITDVERDVFLMREIGGLSYEEIAAACDLTPDAVRSRLHRARQQLRELLDAPISEQRQRGVRIGKGENYDRRS
jgi:RNA polymerase sigma-70 factor (ECF subfamily)